MLPLRRGSISRYVRFNAIRRGLLGGSRFWTAVLVAGYVRRWSHKVTKRGEMPVITSDRLQPGESFVIRHIRPGDE